MRLVAVMLGGAAGALARWAIQLAVPSVQGFPLATFLINISGAFGLGLVGVLLLERLRPIRWRGRCWGLGSWAPTRRFRPWPWRGCGCWMMADPSWRSGYWLATLLVGQMAGVWGMWLGRLRPGRRHGVERREQAAADLHR
jgi:CrcB protein